MNAWGSEELYLKLLGERGRKLCPVIGISVGQMEGVGLSNDQVRLKIALSFYWLRKLSFGKAAAVAGNAKADFENLLRDSGISNGRTQEDVCENLTMFGSMPRR